MLKNPYKKCTFVICHSEEIRKTLFEIVERMNCNICEISSLGDLLDFFQESDLPIMEFSETPDNSILHPSNNSGEIDINNMTNHNARIKDDSTLSEVEKHIIINVLIKCDWNKKNAAKILGIDRSTLYRKIRKYKITESHKQDVKKD